MWKVTRARNDKDCDLTSLGEQLAGETTEAMWDSTHHGDHTVVSIKAVPDAETIVTVAEDGSMCFWAPTGV